MRAFAAIVVAVVAPVAGGLLVCQASMWAGYGDQERLLLLKGLALLLAVFLGVTSVTVFVCGLTRDRRKVRVSSEGARRRRGVPSACGRGSCP